MKKVGKVTLGPRGEPFWIGSAIVAIAVVGGVYWFLFTPRSTDVHRGAVVSWTASQERTIPTAFYKMKLQVKLEDGRTIVAYSERRIAPAPATPVAVQERHGWIGPSSFVEIPLR